MSNGGYIALALSIASNVAMVAGIAAFALGASLVAAFSGGGATFLGVATLVLTIMHMTGMFSRKSVGSVPPTS
ncbi:hypothetical protein ACGFJC_39955 [Nonomuraea fuscirosea]|uniref:hypothetical protein n=1 Tax=Nonomuraea fuscirosea TaxID=1291556 RepID=UPI0037121343